jgi:serine/threonine protein kinase
MAPEQISINPEAPEAGKHSDIFSLGALLYAMLATVGPFEGKDRDEQLYKTLTADPPPLEAVAPPGTVIPPEMAAICAKAMAKNPADRYGSPEELRLAVMNVQDKYFLASLSSRRRRAQVSGLILLVFIIAAVAAFLLKYC